MSDGVYSDVTTVMINLRAANMYPPIFTRDEYIVNDLVEKDQSAVGRLITTVQLLFISVYIYIYVYIYTHIHLSVMIVPVRLSIGSSATKRSCQHSNE